MAADMAEFLWNKSSDDLREIENVLSSASPLLPHFQAIKTVMETQNRKKKRKICCSMSSQICQSLYNLSDVIAECKIFALRSESLSGKLILFKPVREFIFAWKMKKRLIDIETDLQKNVQEKEEEGEEVGEAKSSLPRIFRTARLTFGDGYDSQVYGFDRYKKQIEEMLFGDVGSRDVGFKAIGIYGIAGTGKTTLAQQIFKSERVSREFPRRVWVCLPEIIGSKEADIGGKIAQFVLEAFDYDISRLKSNTTFVDLLEILKTRLSDKRCLVVFDAVWHWHIPDSYVNLGERLHEETRTAVLPRSCGNAVIVTSRLKEVARKIVGDNLIHLEPLLDEDQKEFCWKIFEHTLHNITTINAHSREVAAKIKYDILHQCHGLPLAAKTLAQVISKKDQ